MLYTAAKWRAFIGITFYSIRSEKDERKTRTEEVYVVE